MMKWLTSCVLLCHLPRFNFGSYAKSTFYYFACKFDDKQVKPLIASGLQFYEYLQADKDLWTEYSKNMVQKDPNFKKKDYLNRNYSHGRNELHTTMFFAHDEKSREKYEKRPEVQAALNNPVDLEVYGVFITPHTMGLRIALPRTAEPLWNENDKPPEQHDPDCLKMEKFCTQKLPNPVEVFAPSNFTTGSRAHATVLTSALSKPVETGLDLVDIEYAEQSCKENPHYRQVQMEEGWSAKMRYYGFGRFVFYLDNRHTVQSIFRKVEI